MEPSETVRRVARLSIAEEKIESLCDRGIFFVAGSIDGAVAMSLFIELLTTKHRSTTKDKPIWFFVNSMGGEIDQGLAIYDTIRTLVEDGREVNMVGMGQVASMAVCVMQAGSKRYSLPNTQFLIHQASMSPQGSHEEVNVMSDSVKELQRLNDIVLGIISQRSGMDMAKLRKISKKTDVSFGPEKAKEFGPNGLIDEVITRLPWL